MLPRSCSGHLYEVLEVAPDSSTEHIKRQYRQLALRLHPDRTNGATTERFQQVEEAHRILSDPEQRRLYDTLGREGMKRLGDFGVPNFLLTVRIIQPVIFAVAFLFAMLLLALILVAVKLDGPKPSWPWAAVLTPLWVISPIFVLLGLACVLASVKAGGIEPFLVGLQLLLLVVIPAVACAALEGGLRPPSRAFIPVLLCYACGALRDLYGLVPTVYAARHREAEDILRGGDGSGAAVDLDSNTSSNASNPSHSPCRSRRYWRKLLQQLLQMVCFTAFACLCFARAAQGPVTDDEGGGADKRRLSFFVVFAPLMVYYGLVTVVDFAIAFLQPDPSSSSSSSGGGSRFHDVDEPVVVVADDDVDEQRSAANANASGGGRRRRPYGTTDKEGATTARPHESIHSSDNGGGSSGLGDSASRRSLCSRLADAILAPFYPACALYMVCMWATKEEIEYNRVPAASLPMHPSVYAATFPLVLALVIPLLLTCCLSCAVSAFLKQSTTSAASSGGDDGSNNEAGEAAATGTSGSPKMTATECVPPDTRTSASAATYNSVGSARTQQPREDAMTTARTNLGIGQTSNTGSGRKMASDID